MVEPTGTYVPANIARLGHHDRRSRSPRQGSSYGQVHAVLYRRILLFPLCMLRATAAEAAAALATEIINQVYLIEKNNMYTHKVIYSLTVVHCYYYCEISLFLILLHSHI
ncbi:unnamed protein product [Schistosoma curassoni]|uniref:Uncharacterized protein n=1 Tax=Schistosoma curassoni TaxID=6186 RepID=A0A183KT94_9TREM|nr:unnamed protein product [Schistosoma curassoni]